MKYQFLIHNRAEFRTSAVSYVTGTVSQKNEFQIISYVNSSRKHWKCKYINILHGLTCLLKCKDSTDNEIPLKPYPEKKTKETAVHYFSSVL